MPSTIFRLFTCCVCSREKDIINFPPPGQIGMFTGCAYIPHMSVSHRDPNTAITQEKLSDFHLILFFSQLRHNSPSYLHPLSDPLGAATTCSRAHVGEARRSRHVHGALRLGGKQSRAEAKGGKRCSLISPPPRDAVQRSRQPQRKLRQRLQRSDSLRSLLEFAAKQQQNPHLSYDDKKNTSFSAIRRQKKSVKGSLCFFFPFCCSDLLRQSDGKDKKLSSGKQSKATILSSLNESRVFSDYVVDVKFQSYLNSKHILVKLKSIQVTLSSKPHAETLVTLTWHTRRKVS